MEDRTKACRLGTNDLFAAVYDGHCGEGCAQYAMETLHHTMEGTAEWAAGDVQQALRVAFHATSDDFMAKHRHDDDESGTTAVAVVIQDGQLHIAGCGDSRAVLCTNGVAEALTRDHSPSDEVEKARITAVGGNVDYGGIISPLGGNYLKCARSLGDRVYKGHPHYKWPRERHLICAEPDTSTKPFSCDAASTSDLVVLCSDGVWDVFTDQKACDIVMASMREEGAPHLAAKALCIAAYQV